MRWIRDNWPQFSQNWELPFGSLTDVVGVALSFIVLCITGYVALRQMRMMRRQTEMMEEQNEAGKRIEAITKQQWEIAETQHQILQEQMSKAARTEVRPSSQSKQGSNGPGMKPIGQEDVETTFQVYNAGNRTADSLYWEVLVKRPLGNKIQFTDLKGTVLEPDWKPISNEVQYDRHRGLYAHKLFRGDTADVIRMRVSNDAPDEFNVLWRTSCDDGPVPAKGYRVLKFTRTSDRFYRVSITSEVIHGDGA